MSEKKELTNAEKHDEKITKLRIREYCSGDLTLTEKTDLFLYKKRRDFGAWKNCAFETWGKRIEKNEERIKKGINSLTQSEKNEFNANLQCAEMNKINSLAEAWLNSGIKYTPGIFIESIKKQIAEYEAHTKLILDSGAEKDFSACKDREISMIYVIAKSWLSVGKGYTAATFFESAKKILDREDKELNSLVEAIIYGAFVFGKTEEEDKITESIPELFELLTDIEEQIESKEKIIKSLRLIAEKYSKENNPGLVEQISEIINKLEKEITLLKEKRDNNLKNLAAGNESWRAIQKQKNTEFHQTIWSYPEAKKSIKKAIEHYKSDLPDDHEDKHTKTETLRKRYNRT